MPFLHNSDCSLWRLYSFVTPQYKGEHGEALKHRVRIDQAAAHPRRAIRSSEIPRQRSARHAGFDRDMSSPT